MNVQLVKSAEGCRLRDPLTLAVLPSIADIDVAPVRVDLDDPHWFRAKECGDIVVVKAVSSAPAAPSVPAADSSAAPAPAATSSSPAAGSPTSSKA